MTARKYHVTVDVSTTTRATLDRTVEADNKTMAEAIAAAQIRQELADHNPPPPLRMIRWQIDHTDATEVTG